MGSLVLSSLFLFASFSPNAFWNPSFASELKLPSVPLSTAVKKGETGLRLEELTLGVQARLRQQAKDFASFRHGKLKDIQKLIWVEGCKSHFDRNPFCAFIQGYKLEKPQSYLEESHSAELSKLVEYISKGQLGAIQSTKESMIAHAFKLFDDWASLQPLADAVLGLKSCPSTAILTALGLKAEEFFPALRFRSLAIAFYSRAVECGNDESAQKAKYRLSLQYIWDGKFEKAEPLLVSLSEQKESDYILRGTFWRMECAKRRRDKKQVAQLQERLQKDFPLSYHALLSDLGSKSASNRFLQTEEPSVDFRSQLKPELNPLAQVVEVLESIQEYQLAIEILNSFSNRLDHAEPAFRLYVAVLRNRAGDTIGQFKILSGLFHDQPGLISRPTLELFYPLRLFDVVSRYGSRVDPYLVAALIRQESAFNYRARSPAGAVGLMQLMFKTARRMERVSRRQLMDVKVNVRLGVKYFVKLLDRYRYDAELALAAYNAGPEKVDDWLKRYPTQNRMLFLDLIPFRETREYVAIISRNYYWYLNLYSQKSKRALASKQKPLVFTLSHSL